MAAFVAWPVTLTEGGTAEQVPAIAAVGEFFPVLGTTPATRLMATLLYQVKPADPATFAAVSAALFAAALAASYIPARRAARLDPAVTLRRE